jgi:hypothetical protein
VVLVDGTAGETLVGINVFNNIIGPSLGTTYRRNYSVLSNATYSEFSSNNNLFYDPSGLLLQKGGSLFTKLTSFKTAIFPNESESVNSNPMFVDVNNSYDFQLQQNSPCRNAGIYVDIDYDAAGNQIISSSVDIGSYQYVKIQPPQRIRID